MLPIPTKKMADGREILPAILYEVESYRQTHRKVAERFACNYWPQPRAVENWNDSDQTFQVKDGYQTYIVILNKTAFDYPVYQVKRLSTQGAANDRTVYAQPVGPLDPREDRDIVIGPQGIVKNWVLVSCGSGERVRNGCGDIRFISRFEAHCWADTNGYGIVEDPGTEQERKL